MMYKVMVRCVGPVRFAKDYELASFCDTCGHWQVCEYGRLSKLQVEQCISPVNREKGGRISSKASLLTLSTEFLSSWCRAIFGGTGWQLQVERGGTDTVVASRRAFGHGTVSFPRTRKANRQLIIDYHQSF